MSSRPGADRAELYCGLDFGTDSVRAVLVDAEGAVAATAVAPYPHGQIVPGSPVARRLFPAGLGPGTALQHPDDWLIAGTTAIRDSHHQSGGRPVAGIGVAFTSCTVVPAVRDGRPLSTAAPDLAARPHAWPKLWKHHGARADAEHLTAVARDRSEPWLDRYGGVVGLEWLLPKILEVERADPEVADAVEVWVEAGDWVVWQLTGAPTTGGDRGVDELVRSTCQAGYKACWSATGGYPGAGYLAAAAPPLLAVVDHKLPGRHRAPGRRAGVLSPRAADRIGLAAGTPVSAAIIDAHAGVAGAGVAEPGTLVTVLGTSGCHMVMAPDEHLIPGVAGVVADGILPGSFGYETGQAAMGDAFDWVRRTCGAPTHDTLAADARLLPPGADGVVALDWFNGCRTPLMDGGLTGALVGLRLDHGPAHLYRAVLEASACGLGWIVETLRSGGVAVDRIVATGGLPHQNPLFVEIVAAALACPVFVHRADHGPAVGAAVLGALAAERFADTTTAVRSMARPDDTVAVRPAPATVDAYREVAQRYRALADRLAPVLSAPPFDRALLDPIPGDRIPQEAP